MLNHYEFFLEREKEVLQRIAEVVPVATTMASIRDDFLENGYYVPCLVTRIRGVGIDLVDWAALAQDLDQDCVAIWNVNRATGTLAGPRSALWGDFDYQKFRRFKGAIFPNEPAGC